MFQYYLGTVVVLYSLFCNGLAINCFYCNSANNSACLDVYEYEEEIRARIIPVVNCERAVQSPVAEHFFCRKIVQTIFTPHRDAEVRVTRGCGWIRHNKECYTANNADHLETVCQCFSDHCNSGLESKFSINMIIVSVILTFICKV